MQSEQTYVRAPACVELRKDLLHSKGVVYKVSGANWESHHWAQQSSQVTPPLFPLEVMPVFHQSLRR